MKRVFSHTVLITITNVLVKAWLAMLYTLAFSAFAVAIYEIVTDPLQLRYW